MWTLALLLLVPSGLAHGQSGPAPAAATAAATAPSEKTVDQTASPELVGQLVNELGITPTQAQGAAGSLFGVAKSRLGVADFAKLASAVPNIEGLLQAAPKTSAADSVAGKATAALGRVGTAAGAAGTLSKLGLKPETIVKLTPALVKAVQSKGGAEVGALLAGALK
jgi:uncharacterized protein VcgC/VcgE DUF2780